MSHELFHKQPALQIIIRKARWPEKVAGAASACARADNLFLVCRESLLSCNSNECRIKDDSRSIIVVVQAKAVNRLSVLV